ncbi:MAG: lysine biosynthesis protein LysW [Anaerolineae bacterium]
MNAICPECEANIALKDVMRGEIITCPDCGSELEVVATEPVKLEPAPMEQEDWGE